MKLYREMTGKEDADAIPWTEVHKFMNSSIDGLTAAVLRDLGYKIDMTKVAPTKFNGKMFGNNADNKFFGTKAAEKMFGLDGDDTIGGGAGKDNIDGGKGDDKINGGLHDDRLFGAAGNDFIEGAEGADYLEGNDVAKVAPAVIHLRAAQAMIIWTVVPVMIYFGAMQGTMN